MRLLVTGGAGFIGSTFVRMALRGELPDHVGRPLEVERLTVLDALTYAGTLTNLADVEDDPRYRFVHGDIRDAELVPALLAEHEAVVHLAAETHVDRSISDQTPFVSTNALGTAVLVGAAVAAGTRRFVHVSTDEVYGSIAEGSWPEDHLLAPNSPYAASKASSDLLALAHHTTHGLDVSVTRCSNNYGPHQYPEKIIPLFLATLADGGDVPLYGDGGNVRDWLHVADHCRALTLVLTGGAAGRIYNIGGGTELTNRELTARLLAAVGAGPERIRHVTDRPGHDRRYSVDDSRIRAELGYAPRVDLDTGLAETVAWYRENEAWWRPLLGARA